MTREDAIKVLKMVEAHGLAGEAKKMAIKALEQINKIADIVDGTIDHFEYDDAMDMLYEIKGVIKND
mgnify:CR=1 FL=1